MSYRESIWYTQYFSFIILNGQYLLYYFVIMYAPYVYIYVFTYNICKCIWYYLDNI